MPLNRANLVLTRMEVDDAESMADGWKDSLLNPANAKSATEAVRNLMLCCAGGGEMVPTTPPGTLEETRRLLARHYAAPRERVERVLGFLRRAAAARGERAPCALTRSSSLRSRPCVRTKFSKVSWLRNLSTVAASRTNTDSPSPRVGS